MMIKKYISLGLTLITLFGITAFVNSDSIFIQFLKKKLNEYNLHYKTEKAYLHTDKTFYKPGEEIWISGYLTDGINHKPSDISNVVYIELIDPKGSTINKKMFKVIGGQCKALLLLPPEAPGGLYKLKAYTKWMKNYGKKYVFEKKLQVQSIIKPNILSKLNFVREAFGAGDTVLAKLNIRDLSNAPIPNTEIKYSVILKGEEALKNNSSTDNEGNAIIKFTLPEKLNSSDGVLNIAFNFKGHQESISRAIPIVLNKIDLQFFPEGGDAIENIQCKMAFKALNEFGKPADVEGVIINSKKEVITSFKSFHQGMGAFNFLPDSNEVYRAQILKPSGITDLFELPKAKPQGCVLHLKERIDNNYVFKISSNFQEKIHFIIQLRGEILYSESMTIKKGQVEKEICLNKKNITGVAQATIFDDFERPIAERLFYINPENKLNIEISANKEEYTPREKVKMKIKVSDHKNNPVQGNFSLSVVNDKVVTFADDKQDNILSYMLLSSDLKGEIYEPSFYFDPEEEKAPQALDYLLLTQGWRRFLWKEVLHFSKIKMTKPDRYDKIIGQITDYSGKGVKAKVYAIDNKRKKYAKIETNDNGSFSISGFDDYRYIKIYAKAHKRKYNRVKINLNYVYQDHKKYKLDNSAINIPEIEIDPLIKETKKVNNSIKLEVTDDKEIIGEKSDFKISKNSTSITMEEEKSGLEEVVVVGYGVQKKSSLTGSISRVISTDIQLSNESVAEALQGRIAGIAITNSNTASNSNSNIIIRGQQFISGNNKPLYLVDNIEITDISQISPNEIESITVLKDAISSALYGTKGANGVVIIETKSHAHNKFLRGRNDEKKFSSAKYINNYNFELVKEFYTPKYSKRNKNIEKDMRETIYWNSNFKTNNKGEANIEFYNSDEVTTFRSIVEGIGNNGLIGRCEFFHHVQKPLNIQGKIPPYLVSEDVIYIPLVITNNTNKKQNGFINIDLPDSWTLTDKKFNEVNVDANSFKEISVGIKIGASIGDKELKISFTNKEYNEVFIGKTHVVKTGFPAKMSYSDRAKHAHFSFDLRDAVNNTTQMSISIYNNVLAEVMDGIESVLRQPHGCFEQVSASTYPNILILKYLKETNKIDKNLETKALNFIKQGYKKLVGYETKEHGFEWFGHTPPHEGLTAFGLMEFNEMKSVYDGVNSKMLNRNTEWLLSRKDGKGGFKTNAGKYGFSGASKKVTNAYIVYTFSELGMENTKYNAEYEKAYNEAIKSKDAYQMALLANACLNRGDFEKAQQLISYVVDKLKKGKLSKLRAEHSIVRSYGKSLSVEVAALWAMALMKNNNENFTQLLTLMDYILGARSYGGFGSTQATVLALKAIINYAGIINKIPENGKVTLLVNKKIVLEQNIDSNDKVIVLDSLEKHLSKGVQDFELIFDNITNPLNFTANANWMQRIPASSDNCKVGIQTQLMKDNCSVSDLVRLSTSLVNKSSQGLPMTIAMVGLPSGLSAQPWQLKKLQEEGVFDFYEIHKNYTVFYYRELAPNDRKQIHLDLKAEIPGTYTAPAGCAYLYYTKENKDWCKGESIVIEPNDDF